MGYSIELIEKQVAKDFLSEHGIIGSKTRFAFGLVNARGTICGVALFGSPFGRRVGQSVVMYRALSSNVVIQLKNFHCTYFISVSQKKRFLRKCEQYIAKNFKRVRFIVTYTDERPMKKLLDSLSWKCQGDNIMQQQAFMHVVKDEVYNPRTCYVTFGTTKKDVLRKVDRNYERIPIPMRTRFLRVLSLKDGEVLKHNVLSFV